MADVILIDKLKTLVEPIVKNLNYELYHIEFVKEKGENYLRIYIDNSEGIGLKDCENVSREVSDMLDIKDPIPYSYYLEVSSPGINRDLYNNEHLEKYKGWDVLVKLKELLKGKRKCEGKLLDFNNIEINIEYNGECISIPRNKISSINLEGEV